MNFLTKTGLLPAIQDINDHRNYKVLDENVNISFHDIVLPAPFGFRPFSQYYNPYSNGCSILCNHPIDRETKETIKKAKEILERKCITIQKSDFTLDDVDEVFVPEVLFRKYTETDSRPQTPTPTITSVTSRISHPRKCITPDPTTMEPEKTQLVLDLRRSLSQNAMSSNGLRYTTLKNKKFSYDNDLVKNLGSSLLQLDDENRFQVLTSSNLRKGMYTLYRHEKGHLLSGIAISTPITSKLSKSNKSFSKTSQNDVRFHVADDYITKRKRKTDTQKNKLNNEQKNIPNIHPNAKDSKENEIPNVQKKKKKKSKTKNPKQDTDKEFKDLTEPKETQVSSYDERATNEGNYDEENAVEMDENCNKKEIEQERYAIDPELIKQLQRELDLDIVDNEFDPQKRMVYEEVYAKPITNRQSSAVTDEIKSLRRELRLNSLITNTESLFSLPRTFSRRSARFELPMNKDSLNEMTSLEYLRSHVFVTNNSHLVYNEVFKMYLDSESTETRLLPTQEIIAALGQVMGRDFTETERNDFFELIDFQELTHIDFRTWCGICSMCERIFASNFAQKYLSKEEDPCHEVELVDFSLLEKKLKETTVNHKLKNILQKIRDT